MRSQRGDAEVMATLILGAIGLVIYAVIAAWSCSSRWAQSGVSTSWGPIQGCLVRMPSGRWVPDDRVRDIDISAPQQQAPQGADIPK